MVRAEHFREPKRLTNLAGGINDARPETSLRDSQTPDSRNIEYNRDSVAGGRGAQKFNNQVAPPVGIRTKAPSSLPPLRFDVDKSVPLRGYGYFPYGDRYDFRGG